MDEEDEILEEESEEPKTFWRPGLFEATCFTLLGFFIGVLWHEIGLVAFVVMCCAIPIITWLLYLMFRMIEKRDELEESQPVRDEVDEAFDMEDDDE